MRDIKDLIRVAKFGKVDELVELIEQGADLNQRCEHGKSILGLVCEIGRIDSAKILLNNGATFIDVNEKLMTASCGNIASMVQEAIHEEADVNYVGDYLEETSLMTAAVQGSVAALKILVENGANLELRNEFGMTALYIAAWQGQPECLAMLIRAGADINTTDQWGNSPVAGICEIEPKWEYAINTLDNGQLEALEILLQNGADPNGKNDDGLTALDLANQNYHLNAANVLKKHNGLEGKYL